MSPRSFPVSGATLWVLTRWPTECHIKLSVYTIHSCTGRSEDWRWHVIGLNKTMYPIEVHCFLWLKTCCTVGTLTRTFVSPILKSRFPFLKTGVSTDMSLRSDFESGVMMLPSSVYVRPLMSGNFQKIRTQRWRVIGQNTRNSGQVEVWRSRIGFNSWSSVSKSASTKMSREGKCYENVKGRKMSH